MHSAITRTKSANASRFFTTAIKTKTSMYPNIHHEHTSRGSRNTAIITVTSLHYHDGDDDDDDDDDIITPTLLFEGEGHRHSLTRCLSQAISPTLLFEGSGLNWGSPTPRSQQSVQTPTVFRARLKTEVPLSDVVIMNSVL